MRLDYLFVIALLLYSGAIWSHRIAKSLRTWMVWIFGIGLATDIAGTIFLCILAEKGWRWNLHTISGTASLVIMAIHFAWALAAIVAKGKSETYFDRFSLRAWCLWLVAFASGLPLW